MLKNIEWFRVNFMDVSASIKTVETVMSPTCNDKYRNKR